MCLPSNASNEDHIHIEQFHPLVKKNIDICPSLTMGWLCLAIQCVFVRRTIERKLWKIKPPRHKEKKMWDINRTSLRSTYHQCVWVWAKKKWETSSFPIESDDTTHFFLLFLSAKTRFVSFIIICLDLARSCWCNLSGLLLSLPRSCNLYLISICLYLPLDLCAFIKVYLYFVRLLPVIAKGSTIVCTWNPYSGWKNLNMMAYDIPINTSMQTHQRTSEKFK